MRRLTMLLAVSAIGLALCGCTSMTATSSDDPVGTTTLGYAGTPPEISTVPADRPMALSVDQNVDQNVDQDEQARVTREAARQAQELARQIRETDNYARGISETPEHSDPPL